MREGMFDRAPLSGLAGGVPVLDFRKAPGSRGGKAGEAARFIAALRAMATQQDRDTFSAAELQVRAATTRLSRLCGARSAPLFPELFGACARKVGDVLWCAVLCGCVLPTHHQDVVKQLQLNARDPRAFIDQLNEAGESHSLNLVGSALITLSCCLSGHACLAAPMTDCSNKV
jgi:hypothetical protein